MAKVEFGEAQAPPLTAEDLLRERLFRENVLTIVLFPFFGGELNTARKLGMGRSTIHRRRRVYAEGLDPERYDLLLTAEEAVRLFVHAGISLEETRPDLCAAFRKDAAQREARRLRGRRAR